MQAGQYTDPQYLLGLLVARSHLAQIGISRRMGLALLGESQPVCLT